MDGAILIHEILSNHLLNNCAYKNWYSLEKGLYSVDGSISKLITWCWIATHLPMQVSHSFFYTFCTGVGFAGRQVHCTGNHTLELIYVKFSFVYI